MHFLLSLKMMILFFINSQIGNIYGVKFTTIEGTSRSMSEFAGKKILILVLSGVKNEINTAYLQRIDSVSKEYADQLFVIGVPFYDDNDHMENEDTLRQYYRSTLGAQVIITRGMMTRKAAGNNQSELFSWLTNSQKNTHFDQDVAGAGQKYFINEKGELFGVLDPTSNLSERMLKRMLK
ncbi:MAG: hypothetical protein J0H74_04640 [Chitinophagaceae bacterium]|nr:hypothetical protein [Chitinophagaceae bacterium]